MDAAAAENADHIAALAADFPAWHIWRSRSSDGRETGWNATRKGRPPRCAGALFMLATGGVGALRAALGQQDAIEKAPTEKAPAA